MAEHKDTLRSVLESIAKEQGFDNATIDINSISSEGANYTSALFLATLSESGKEDIKAFNKVACVGENFRSIAPFQIYQTEICFYNELIKIYQDMELKYDVPEEHKFIVPKFYGFSDEYLKETLVMEDLTADGYEMFDRFKTFDYNYATEAVRQLAKFHALSIAHSIKHPEEFERKTKNLKMQNNIDSMFGMMQGLLANALNSLQEEYKERVQSFLKEMLTVEKMTSLIEPHRRMVLAHGDFRPSNIMHQLNEDGTYKLIVIDFQTLHRSNPIVDLIYFIFSGSDQAFRDKHLQQTLDHYYSELTASLKLFQLNPDEVYSREDFENDYKEVLPYGLMIGFMLLLLITVDKENVPTITEVSGLDAFVITPNQEYKKRTNELVEDFIKYGVL